MVSARHQSLAQALIERALIDAPTVRLHVAPDGGIELQTPRRRIRLVLLPHGEVPGSLPHNPNDAGVKPIYVLEHSTPDQRARLRNADVSFVDLSRRIVRVSIPGMLIDRSDLEKPTARTRSHGHARNPFSDRASLITRALLEEREREWSLQEMAKYVHLSAAMVSRVLKQLRGLHLVDAPDTRRHPLRFTLGGDPWPLFLAWTEHYAWTDNPSLTVAAPIGAPASSLRRVAEALSSLPSQPRWAFALQAAAHLIAPHASWDTVHAYVGVRDASDLRDIASQLGWPESAHGRLVLMAPKYRQSVWWKCSRAKAGLSTVSVIQTLLDLWHYPVRGREQAEYLSRRIKWPSHGDADAGE